MTNVSIDIKENDISVQFSGHSGYAEIGSDIVCAGVSALANAWLSVCADLGEQCKVHIVNFESRDGFVSIDVVDEMNLLESALQMLVNGIELICEEYPDYAALHVGRN